MFPLDKAVGALLDGTVTRRLQAPASVRVVAIGGATLGGSGKTPLAIACAAELAAFGARVALVGHAYRADPGCARYVSPADPLEEVGDEALLAARALELSGAPARAHPRARVVVAPSRAEAIAWAAEAAEILVLDGVAQLRPAPAALALLSVDAGHPWGHRRALPSRGGLRAPVATLVAACDAVVTMGDGAADAELERLGRTVWPSRIESRGVWVDGGTLMTWEAVRAVRVGLLTALARPERLIGSLARRGVFPRAVLRGRDHGPFARSAPGEAERASRRHGIDLWLATPKCALHAVRGLPALWVGVVDHAVTLHPELRRRLRGMVDPREQARGRLDRGGGH